MNMKKLTTLLLTATLGLASGAALAADTGAQSNNGQANSSADAGQVAPDARENVAPNNVDNSQINSGSGGTTGSTMTQDNMSSDEVHKNSMCKDGRCPDTGKKLDNGGNTTQDNSKTDGTTQNARIGKLYQFEGLARVEHETAALGDIVAVTGITDLNIGETACDPECVEALPFVRIDEPTISMIFMVNNSPFAGQEGKFVTSRNLRDRLFKEVETNVSMRVKETDTTDAFEVSGRGELHLSILIETMRRQGFEFAVSRPQVIYKKDENGKLLEPMELLMIEVPEQYVGAVMEKLGARKAEIVNMGTRDTGVSHLEFRIPARGLMGYRQQFLTDTNGNGIMNSVFDGYEPYKGDIPQRVQGSLVAFETGETSGYGSFNAQDRGIMFVGPGLPVYEGMIVGQSPKNEDVAVNVCKKKHVTNMRAAGSDEALRLTPPTVLSLEQSLEFINDDELVEVTPKSIRLRKRILSKEQRMKEGAKKKA